MSISSDFLFISPRDLRALLADTLPHGGKYIPCYNPGYKIWGPPLPLKKIGGQKRAKFGAI